MRDYKAKNKRIIKRGPGGRFRETTLTDIGVGVCEKCNSVFTPDKESYKTNGFIDPSKFRKAYKICPSCLSKEKL
jgi:hypothetical protein